MAKLAVKAACAIALLAAWDTGSRSAVAQSDAQRAIQAMQSRHDSTPAFIVKWTETETIARGSLQRPPQDEFPQPDPDAVIPPRDVTLEVQYRLVVDGEAIRFEQDGEIWSVHRNGPYRQRLTRVYSGGDNRLCIFESTSPYPIGEIEAGDAVVALFSERAVTPFKLALRVFDQRLRGFDPANFAMTGQSGIVEGVECVLASLERRRDLETQLWLDPARGYLPLRYTVGSPGRPPNTSLTISYAQDSDGFWHPSRWTWTQSTEGAFVRTIRGEVVEFSRPRTVARREFALAFPTGTWVYDKVDNRRYIVKSFGWKRYLKVNEAAADYERIMNEGRVGLVGLVAIVVIAAFAMLAIYARRRGLRGG